MKKIITTLCFGLLLALGTQTSMAQDTTIVRPVSEVFGSGNGEIFGQPTKLQDYSTNDEFSRITGGNNDPKYKGAYQIRNIAATVITFIEKMMVPIAIVFFLWAALNLLIQRGDEEKFRQRVRQIVWTGAGFLLFVFAYGIVDYMVFGVQGNIFQGNGTNVGIFGQWAQVEVLGFVNFISSFVVALAVFFIVLGAMQLILIGEQEEQQTKIRRQLVFTAIGILLIAFANIIANIFFAGDPSGNLSVNSSLLISQLVKWTNILLGFIALGAVISIIWAGIQMILHFGNEEAINKSKKIIMYAVIGLVLAFSAFTIVRFFLTPGVYADNDASPKSILQPFDRGVVNP